MLHTTQRINEDVYQLGKHLIRIYIKSVNESK